MQSAARSPHGDGGSSRPPRRSRRPAAGTRGLRSRCGAPPRADGPRSDRPQRPPQPNHGQYRAWPPQHRSVRAAVPVAVASSCHPPHHIVPRPRRLRRSRRLSQTRCDTAGRRLDHNPLGRHRGAGRAATTAARSTRGRRRMRVVRSYAASRGGPRHPRPSERETTSHPQRWSTVGLGSAAAALAVAAAADAMQPLGCVAPPRAGATVDDTVTATRPHR